jgi:hypothetical protein
MTTLASRDLERDLERLQGELERYQAATEAALDSLDHVIGWLERYQRTGLARDLRRNRATILRQLRRDASHRWIR